MEPENAGPRICNGGLELVRIARLQCLYPLHGVLELTAMNAAGRLLPDDKHHQPAFEGQIIRFRAAH